MCERRSLTLGSLFDGSGGFPLGGILSGIIPVFASEVDPFAIRVTSRRMPQIKHVGDVSKLSGADLPPVDIITFGSPCQDMSIAGKRAGLDGSRSGLFHEAIRIIREMREKTNGKSPRYIVWENVLGAFSSNSGADFRSVLQEICGVKDDQADVPQAAKWEPAGEILGEDYSVAWRVFDAQYWGVPQRRKRIYLVADFAGQCAADILFKSEGLSGYSAEGFRAWQRAASGFADGAGETGRRLTWCINPQGSSGVYITDDFSGTLVAQDHGNHPAVLQAAGFCTEHSAQSRGVGYQAEVSPTLRAETVPAAIAVQSNPSDSRLKIAEDGVIQTLTRRAGTGGNNVPLVAEPELRAFNVCSMSSRGMLSGNPKAGFYEASTSRTLDHNGGSPVSNQGGICVVETAGEHYSTSHGSFHTDAFKEQTSTLTASDWKDPPTVTDISGDDPVYIVRRLMPVECARLQGFPDWWCSGLGTENPTEEEISFWTSVFETWRQITHPGGKPKTRNQIIKWLKDPYTDGAEYRLWGNGVSLPVVFFVLAGIVWADALEN